MALNDVEAIVVVPARDEEDRIAGCLEALARQTLPPERFEIIVVLDRCRDATAAVAERTAAALRLEVEVIQGFGTGVGAARRAGMDLAAERLLAAGRPQGLIACTDADSQPEADWLRQQLTLVEAGAQAIAGLVELDPTEVGRLPPEALVRRAVDANARLASVRALDSAAEHHHFGGASLAVTAEAYRSVGGLEPRQVLEDEGFAARLQEHGVPIHRSASVRVITSARRRGRAARGLAADLDLSAWAARRRYDHRSFDVGLLQELKGDRSIAVIVPAKEVAATIGGVLLRTVGPLADAGLLDEVVVVDAGSSDGTAAIARDAGVHVLQQDALLAEYGPALGKGDAMWRGVDATSADLVCFLDSDTVDPSPAHLTGLLGPLLVDPGIELVKGAFARPLRTVHGDLPHEGGRVTELMARPLLNLHEPRLAGFAQPLAGEFAARRELLESIPFPVGYGVEIAILIDALRLRGLDALAESQLGTRQNTHQPLRALGEMAYAVLAAVEARLPAGRGTAGGHYVRQWESDRVIHVPVNERPPLREHRERTSSDRGFAADRVGKPSA